MTTQMSNVIPGSNASTGAQAVILACAGAPVAAVNDVQTITVDSCTHSTLTLTGLPGGLNYTAAQDVTTSALQTALNNLLGAGSVTVTGTYSAGSGGTYIITWSGGNYAGRPMSLLGVSAVFVGGSSPAVAIVHTTPGVLATYGNVAPKGALLVDVTNAALYQNTGTQLVPVWTAAPSGANPSVTTLTVSGLSTLSGGLTETGPVILTPGAVSALALDVTAGPVYTKTIGADSTFTASAAGTAGQVIWLVITASGAQRVATMGTNLNSSGTLTIPSGKVAVIGFVSDGTSFREFARAING